jgi:DNA polymerase-3 subunit beta
MNLTVNSQLFAKELRSHAKIAPTKATIPILSHVLLKADDRLHLSTTDLELALSTICPSQITAPGVVALPVAKLLAMCEQFADGDIQIALDKTHASITCGAFKSRMQAMAPDDFPQLPEPEGASCALDGKALRQLIDRTRYAITSEDTRYFMAGALLVLAGPTAAMVATDGKRLAMATASRTGADARVLIPAKTLDVLAHQNDAEVELTIGERHIFFASGDKRIVSRMIDGQFPTYERVIPKGNYKVVSVGRAALAAALRRVGLVSEVSKSVTFAFSPQTLDLSSSSAEIVSADERLAVSYEGSELKVCMNGDYVLDFLTAASGQIVTMALKNAEGPILFTDGDDHLGVIMPMRA